MEKGRARKESEKERRERERGEVRTGGVGGHLSGAEQLASTLRQTLSTEGTRIRCPDIECVFCLTDRFMAICGMTANGKEASAKRLHSASVPLQNVLEMKT